MAAYFPNPPVLTVPISPWIKPDFNNEVPLDWGPRYFNGARWIVGYRQVSSYYIEVLKSTNGGNTWAAQDSANTPTHLDGNFGDFDYWFDVVNGIIHLLGYRAATTGNNLSYCTFNMNTGLFGATIDGAIRCGSSTGHIRLRADGTPIVFFVPLTGAGGGTAQGQPIQYSLISGGVFGAPVTFAAGAGVEIYNPLSTILAADGLLHLLYQSNTAELRHISLSGAGVVTSPQVAYTNPGPTVWNRHLPIGIGQEFGGSLFWAVEDTNLAQVIVLKGTTSATPTWSTLTAATVVSSAKSPTFQAHVLPFGSGISVWYCEQKNDFGHTLQKCWYVTSDGSTFSAPILGWDINANPVSVAPTPPEAVQFFNVSANPNGVEFAGVCYIDADFDLTVVFLAPSMVVSCNNPPAGQVGHAYTTTFTTVGGTAPYTYSIGGFIPPGLSLNASTGVLSGTPTVPGTYVFSVTVVDANSSTSSVTCSIVITQFLLSCNTPPGGTVGVAYSHTLAVTGGTSPFAFTITSGALPNGLSLSGSLGAITGTPTAEGTFTFTVRVVDANGLIASVTCSITIGIVCNALRNPQVAGTQVPIDADTELYLRRFINDMSGAMTPSDQN